MGLSLKLVCVRPTFLVIFTTQPLKDVRGLFMVGAEEMITGSQQWNNVKQHVVSEITVVIAISFSINILRGKPY